MNVREQPAHVVSHFDVAGIDPSSCGAKRVVGGGGHTLIARRDANHRGWSALAKNMRDGPLASSTSDRVERSDPISDTERLDGFAVHQCPRREALVDAHEVEPQLWVGVLVESGDERLHRADSHLVEGEPVVRRVRAAEEFLAFAHVGDVVATAVLVGLLDTRPQPHAEHRPTRLAHQFIGVGEEQTATIEAVEDGRCRQGLARAGRQLNERAGVRPVEVRFGGCLLVVARCRLHEHMGRGCGHAAPRSSVRRVRVCFHLAFSPLWCPLSTMP